MNADHSVLLVGGSGQIGGALLRLAPPGWAIAAPDRHRLDLADPSGLDAAVAARDWALIVNCAAYTAVDEAETNGDLVHRINAESPGRIATAAAARGIPFIHLSTDYVFDGTRANPYREDDTIGPINAYGRSKAAGEAAVRAAGGPHVLVRTSWVYDLAGRNFVRTMLRLFRERAEIRVVDDQHGAPTAAGDIARAIATIGDRVMRAPAPDLCGTFHFAAAGETTWFGIAARIAAHPSVAGPRPRLVPVSSADYPTPARRPANSRLDCAKIARVHGIVPPHWEASLDPIVESICASGERT
jgi:dTDP-4-dehydrorhamnose reductase